MDRNEKKALIAELNGTFQDNELVVVAHYRGLTVAQMTELRVKLREQGASLKVTKNSLARIAAKGTRYEGIADLFEGPTAIAYSTDPVVAAKVAADFAKDNDNLVICGGGLGEKMLDVAGVAALAKLPSLDELRAKLLALVNTPAQRIATIAQAPASQLARVTKAYADKG